MGNPPMYHGESRKLQDQFDTRRLADRLVERLLRTTFGDDDRNFIESQRVFFLATTDAEGFPDCSHKGGDPGFVRVIDERTLVFLSYIPRMQMVEVSPYVPRAGCSAPIPDWKKRPQFKAADIRRANVILLGHGHHDHMSDAASVATRTGAVVVGAPVTAEKLLAQSV